jgi:SAM-dependent methyltransferase
MLHKRKIALAIWRNAKRQVRIHLGIKPRHRAWPQDGFDHALQRSQNLARRFLEQVPPGWDVRGKHICEVGCSDCFSIASLLLGMGAAHVDLVEPAPPVLNPLQVRILKTIQQHGFTLDTGILREGVEITLDETKITYQNCFLHALAVENRYDYLFSFQVMEHVENLPEFYSACHRVLKKNGAMFHLVDFSGHSELEDPVPPLDFQTYPDWLFYLMYPPFHRATRCFLSQHLQAMTQAGLDIENVRVNRKAEPAYLAALRPNLRKKARLIPLDEIEVLEATIVSHKG